MSDHRVRERWGSGIKQASTFYGESEDIPPCWIIVPATARCLWSGADLACLFRAGGCMALGNGAGRRCPASCRRRGHQSTAMQRSAEALGNIEFDVAGESPAAEAGFVRQLAKGLGVMAWNPRVRAPCVWLGAPQPSSRSGSPRTGPKLGTHRACCPRRRLCGLGAALHVPQVDRLAGDHLGSPRFVRRGPQVQQYGAVILSILLALATASWGYGVYCYIQMVRHRQPGVDPFRLGWSAAQLTERGRAFRQQALRSYGAFAVLAALLVLLGRFLRGR